MVALVVLGLIVWLARLQWEVTRLNRELVSLRLGSASPTVTTFSPAAASPPAVPPLVSDPTTPIPAPERLPPLPPLPPLAREPKRSFDWENVVGVRLFAWLGGASLFLGGALFLGYSIEHDLISPASRVVLGFVVGVLGLVFGDRLRVRGTWAAQAASGGAVGILYASTYAARALYDLIAAPIAFLLFITITFSSGALAVRRRAYVLAVLATVGGFATPYLLAVESKGPEGLFVYLCILNVCALILARSVGWNALRTVAFVCLSIVFGGWAVGNIAGDTSAAALVAGGFLSLTYLLVPSTDLDRTASDEGTNLAAFIAPFVLAAWCGSEVRLHVDPALLAPYLAVLLCALVFMSGARPLAKLLPVAAAFAMLSLVLRGDSQLFDEARGRTLALFALVPAAAFVVAVVRRAVLPPRSMDLTLGILAAGSLLVVARASGYGEATVAKAAPVLGYVAVHAVLLSAWGCLTGTLALFVAAEILPLAAIAVLTALAVPCGAVWPLATFSPLWLCALPLVARAPSSRSLRSAGACALPAYAMTLRILLGESWSTTTLVLHIFGLALLGGVLALVATQRDRNKSDMGEAQVAYVAAAACTAAVAIAVIVGHDWLIVASAASTAVLALLCRREPREGLLLSSVVGLGIASAGLLVHPDLYNAEPLASVLPLWNRSVYTFGAPALLFVVACLAVPAGMGQGAAIYRAALGCAAAVCFFVLLQIEIGAPFDAPGEPRFRLVGGTFAEDLTHSLVWLGFGASLFAVGTWRRLRTMRIGSTALVLSAVAKVFLHDVWRLGSLYRIASLVCLAVCLLLISLVYQRTQDKAS